jgi:hypothetical protein
MKPLSNLLRGPEQAPRLDVELNPQEKAQLVLHIRHELDVSVDKVLNIPDDEMLREAA